MFHYIVTLRIQPNIYRGLRPRPNGYGDTDATLQNLISDGQKLKIKRRAQRVIYNLTHILRFCFTHGLLMVLRMLV